MRLGKKPDRVNDLGRPSVIWQGNFPRCHPFPLPISPIFFFLSRQAAAAESLTILTSTGRTRPIGRVGPS